MFSSLHSAILNASTKHMPTTRFTFDLANPNAHLVHFVDSYALTDILQSFDTVVSTRQAVLTPNQRGGVERIADHAQEDCIREESESDKKLDCLPMRSARHFRRDADLGGCDVSHRAFVRRNSKSKTSRHRNNFV